MIVFDNGNYETGDWLTAETYPERVCYVIDEKSELAKKIFDMYPYFTMNVVDGVIVGVTPREKTPEEIAAENAPKPPAPKTADQLRIEALETENAQLKLDMADVQLALADLFTV